MGRGGGGFTAEGGGARPAASVGILATDPDELAATRASLAAGGFTEADIRFLTVRNYGENHEDGYSGMARFLAEAAGRYLLVLHQDVRLIEGRAALEAALDRLDRDDPAWAVAGNAGFARLLRLAWRITDPAGEDQRRGRIPAPVMSLDENTLVLNLRDPVRPSPGLSGFHFYGTDLCLQARLAGRRAWVIDWHVRHLSRGTRRAAWKAGIADLEAAYDGRLGHRIVATPTTLLLFGVFRGLRPIRHKAFGALWRLVGVLDRIRGR